MKHFSIIIGILLLSSCTTVQGPSPFYDIRDVDGVSYYIAEADLMHEVVEAFAAYAPIHNYTQEDIDRAVVLIAGELYLTETAVRHYLDFKRNHQSKD